jgi:tetratricopeptide (TPR) repeat protein
MRRRPALLLLLALASAAFGDDEGIRAVVARALEHGDRAAALAALDAVAGADAPHDRRRGVDAARAAMDLVGGPEGNVRAARILVGVLRSDRSDREGAYSLAMALRTRAVRREIDAASAQELFRGLAELYPESLEFAYDLALAYRDAGLSDEARAVYARIAEVAPSETRARHELAVLDEDRGALDEALAVYDDLIRLHAQDPRPDLRAHWSKASLLLWKSHDVAAARRALDAGTAAANAAAPGPERDEYVSRFDSFRIDLELEEEHRVSLREVGKRLDSTLWAAAAAWLIALGGGVACLRRAKWL